MIKSDFMVKKYSVQSVGLNARLPQEEEAEEWRPREKEASSAEAMMEPWLLLEGLKELVLFVSLGRSPKSSFNPSLLLCENHSDSAP